MLAALAGSEVLRGARFLATGVPDTERALAAADVGRDAGRRSRLAARRRAIDDADAALDAGARGGRSTAARSIIAGSLYLVGHLRSRLVPDDHPETTVPELMPPLRVRELELRFGERTYVMGIINMTPDSFSGDGLLGGTDSGRRGPWRRRSAWSAEGADIIDVGGESTRPGHDPVSAEAELERVVAVVSGIREPAPGVPISIDTQQAGGGQRCTARPVPTSSTTWLR